MQTFQGRPVIALRSDHAEGPCWDERTGTLLWVDQYAGLVNVAEFDSLLGELTVRRTYNIGVPVGAVVPSAGTDDWVMACAAGFARLRPDDSVELLAQPESAATRRMRMNDGKCDPSGAFWAGSMAWDKTAGAGTLYRLGPDGDLGVVLRELTISNGLAWSEDGTQMYFIDTPTQRIERFDVHPDGRLTNPTPVVTIDRREGQPDGMAIDAEGCLWVALWNGWSVRRYSPTGELLATVAVDAPQVSSCCFGGPGLNTLFITTSQEDMTAQTRERYPNSGRLFCAEVGVAGRPADRYGSLA
ncbi:MAG: SMP-30/gluconolactonase/LRE family protein [Actinobacteria bacterium]|nr:SMP-30/gluconolactonase/LRE family protein [Actinomycetota bacterium]MBO0834545.1 SMP-30/gluconolactonase/LRE family protein [Actinomycetota bacterium]